MKDMKRNINKQNTEDKQLWAIRQRVINETMDYIRREKPELLTRIDEGLITMITSAIVGPEIGKVVANALGVEKGLLYDFLTSRLTAIAIGEAIVKYLSNKL